MHSLSHNWTIKLNWPSNKMSHQIRIQLLKTLWFLSASKMPKQHMLPPLFSVTKYQRRDTWTTYISSVFSYLINLDLHQIYATTQQQTHAD